MKAPVVRLQQRPDAADRLPWMPWFPGDFLAETQGWPLAARAAYRELLDAQWNMGVLPVDPHDLRKLIIGMSLRDWRLAWLHLAAKFPQTGTGRQNALLEKRRRKASKARAGKQAGAGLTNVKRWGKSDA
jgi:uncharacterized protein YdaU (DUF1376 family)